MIKTLAAFYLILIKVSEASAISELSQEVSQINRQVSQWMHSIA